MIALLYALPWLVALLMQEPYGYLFAVGGCAGMEIVFAGAAAGAELITYGRYRFILLVLYLMILIEVFLK